MKRFFIILTSFLLFYLAFANTYIVTKHYLPDGLVRVFMRLCYFIDKTTGFVLLPVSATLIDSSEEKNEYKAKYQKVTVGKVLGVDLESGVVEITDRFDRKLKFFVNTVGDFEGDNSFVLNVVNKKNSDLNRYLKLDSIKGGEFNGKIIVISWPSNQHDLLFVARPYISGIVNYEFKMVDKIFIYEN